MTLTHLKAAILRPDAAALSRALRGTSAALIALCLAIWLGLDSPYWSAMTVIIVAQPSRDQLLGKGLARLAGTLIGAMVSILMVKLNLYSPVLFVISLALWVGLCVLMAGLLRGFHVYAAQLAGITASLVSLVAIHHPELALETALDRMACISLGVVVSILFSWLWLPSMATRELGLQGDRLVTDACRWILARLTRCEDERKTLFELEVKLVSDLAALDAQCDLGGSGALKAQRQRRSTRRLLVATLDAVAAARAVSVAGHTPLSMPLGADSDATVTLPQLLVLIRQWQRQPYADEVPGFVPRMEVLYQRLQALSAEQDQFSQQAPGNKTTAPLPSWRHRDWADAVRGGARTSLVLLLLGAGWLLSGWTLLLMSMLGAAVLCSVFGLMELPQQGVINALKGTFGGTIAAIICSLGILTHVESLPMIVLALVPFLFVGGLMISRRETAIIGTDFSMVFLLLTAVKMPLAISPQSFLSLAPGPLLGAVAAALALHYLLPTGPKRRFFDLQRSLKADIRQLTAPDSRVGEDYWRTRTLHRSLRLVSRSLPARLDAYRVVRKALARINLGSDLFVLKRRLAENGMDDAFAAQVRAVLAQMQQGIEAGVVAPQFEALAAQAHPDAPEESELLGAIAVNLESLAS